MSAEDSKKKKVAEGAPAETEAAAAAEGTVPEAALAELKDQNAALADQLLRKAAEFENFRKRMFREREEGIRYANAALLADLLPVIDDFERAIQSADDSRDFASFHSGVTMIERQLVSLLERNWGLRRFTAKSGPEGEPFDPEKHEAIAMEPGGGREQIVLENYVKGYYLHDRILRPAKVKVSKPAEDQTTESKE